MKRFILAAASVAALGGGALFSALPAGAVVTPLQVTLSNSQGDAASALFNASGNVILTPGTLPYPPGTFAEIDINGAAGAAVPTNEPTFATDNYNAGSPRWVIELANGKSLWGYPPNAHLNGSDFGWAVNNGNSYVSYSAACATAGCSSTTVTDAFVVADGDQTVGTHDTITGLQYNGQYLDSGCMVNITQTVSPQNVTEGGKASIQVVATTNTSDKALAYAATGLPSWLTINPTTGLITGTAPSSTSSTTVHVKVTNTAYDNDSDAGCHAYETFAVNVVAASPAPSPSPSSTGGTTTTAPPTGGIQTGGGKVGTTSFPWVPLGIPAALFLFGFAGFAVRRAVRQGHQGS